MLHVVRIDVPKQDSIQDRIDRCNSKQATARNNNRFGGLLGYDRRLEIPRWVWDLESESLDGYIDQITITIILLLFWCVEKTVIGPEHYKTKVAPHHVTKPLSSPIFLGPWDKDAAVGVCRHNMASLAKARLWRETRTSVVWKPTKERFPPQFGGWAEPIKLNELSLHLTISHQQRPLHSSLPLQRVQTSGTARDTAVNRWRKPSDSKGRHYDSSRAHAPCARLDRGPDWPTTSPRRRRWGGLSRPHRGSSREGVYDCLKGCQPLAEEMGDQGLKIIGRKKKVGWGEGWEDGGEGTGGGGGVLETRSSDVLLRSSDLRTISETISGLWLASRKFWRWRQGQLVSILLVGMKIRLSSLPVNVSRDPFNRKIVISPYFIPTVVMATAVDEDDIWEEQKKK